MDLIGELIRYIKSQNSLFNLKQFVHLYCISYNSIEQSMNNKNQDEITKEQIYLLLSKIKDSMGTFENYQLLKQKLTHDRLLMSYVNILFKTSEQLRQAKQRYQSINKEALIDKKCLYLATSLSYYKKESYTLNDQVKRADYKLKQIKKSNNCLLHNVEGLKKQLKTRQANSSHQKSFYIQQAAFLSEPRNVQTFFPSNNNFLTCDQANSERKNNENKVSRLSKRTKKTITKIDKQYFSEADYQSFKRQF